MRKRCAAGWCRRPRPPRGLMGSVRRRHLRRRHPGRVPGTELARRRRASQACCAGRRLCACALPTLPWAWAPQDGSPGDCPSPAAETLTGWIWDPLWAPRSTGREVTPTRTPAWSGARCQPPRHQARPPCPQRTRPSARVGSCRLRESLRTRWPCQHRAPASRVPERPGGQGLPAAGSTQTPQPAPPNPMGGRPHNPITMWGHLRTGLGPRSGHRGLELPCPLARRLLWPPQATGRPSLRSPLLWGAQDASPADDALRTRRRTHPRRRARPVHPDGAVPARVASFIYLRAGEAR